MAAILSEGLFSIMSLKNSEMPHDNDRLTTHFTILELTNRGSKNNIHPTISLGTTRLTNHFSVSKQNQLVVK